MKNKNFIITFLITIIISVVVVLLSTNVTSLASPIEVYKVYLNGKTIGFIKSEEELLNIIDEKQNEIKKKYNTNKVYPPNGLNIEKVSTYNTNLKSAEEVYNLIEESESFTIEGYVVTIKYKEEGREPLQIYTLTKDYFDEAFYNAVAAFVGAEQLDAYKNNTQVEIKEEGEHIESIYWEEKEGDTINDIIDKNNLSIEEFLVANPNIPDKDILLSKGQQVSIGLIAPVVTIVHEIEKIEKITNKYETEYKTDSSLFSGQTKVIQEGVNGVDKVTEKIQFKNGDINQLIINKSEQISPTINKIIAKGSKAYNVPDYNYTPVITGDEWLWPTIKPYIITSGFKWRWGKHHNGIDISGCGFGSPIYSSTTGTVTEVVSSCADVGYYNNSCGNYWGNHVTVSYNGYKIIYAHIRRDVKVKVGDTVTRGQKLGTMGSSGSSTGTHLHYGVVNPSGNYINPCSVISC